MWHQGSNKVRSEPVLSLVFDVLMRMRNIFLQGWLEETLVSSNFIIQMAMKCRWIGLPVTFSDTFISCYVVASVKMNQYLSSCFLRKKKKKTWFKWYEKIKKGNLLYDRFRCTVLAMSMAVPPACSSNHCFMRSRQWKESCLKNVIDLKAEKINQIKRNTTTLPTMETWLLHCW